MLMSRALRLVLGFAIGLVVSFLLVVAVEMFSEAVYPAPLNAAESMEVMCMHVAGYPHWILGVVVGMWSGIALVGTWVASRLGNLWSGIALAFLLFAGLVLNLTMLPYTMWFKVVMPMCFLIASWVGVRSGGRRSGPKADAGLSN